MIKLIIRTTGIAFLVSAALLVALTAFANPGRVDSPAPRTTSIKGATTPMIVPTTPLSTATTTLPSSTFTPTPTLTPSVTPDCASLWTIVDSPNVGFGGSFLLGVASVAQNDVWAIGYYTDSMAVEQTLIEHWDGVRWSVVASPDVGTTGSAHNRLHGIAAVSANDIWAVGYFQPIATSQRSTLILHWDGSSWNVVPDTSLGELKAVSALATDDVWAVGEASETYRTLTMHWNGQTWQVVAGPDIYDSTLNGVAMVAANDVWAVGRQFDQFLVEHWDGSAWSAVDVAPPAGYSNSFYGVDALDANNIWAIGQCCWDPQVATIYHWDGNAWSFSAIGYPDFSVA